MNRQSKCCKALAKVEGEVTRYYMCSSCDCACDTLPVFLDLTDVKSGELLQEAALKQMPEDRSQSQARAMNTALGHANEYHLNYEFLWAFFQYLEIPMEKFEEAIGYAYTEWDL